MFQEERELNSIVEESSGTKRKKLSKFKASSDPVVEVNADSSHSCADTSEKINVGDLFEDKSELKCKIELIAMRESFEFKPQFSDKSRYVIKCVDPDCIWKLRATRLQGSNGFVVTKYINEHKCDASMRNVNHRQANAKLLGTMVSDHFHGGKLGLKPKQIMETIRKDHGVKISYQKAWRAQEFAQEFARGDCAESYALLPRWFHMVNVKNPGSATYLELDEDQRFKYGFLAFGASLRGFKLMRKVVVVDGTFLKSKYKGTLLGASAQDGNLQLYPLAFCIVDSENDASWDWFLRCLQNVIPDAEDLVFVSDRAPSISKALITNYPRAHHGICSFHFEKNVELQFRNSTLAPLVSQAARAYTKDDFNQLYYEIKDADEKLAEYLIKADLKKWTRAYSPGNRYNVMTSNLAESLNSMLKLTREYPIVCLFDTIRSTLTRWFHERRELGKKHMKEVTVEVGKKMKTSYDTLSRWFEVFQINQFEFEVRGDKRKHVVNLERRQCTCRMFDIDKIPCSHAIAATKHIKVNESDFVSEYFSNERLIQAYSESINPVGDQAFWQIPAPILMMKCLPPFTRTPSGRPKKNRFPSTWEYAKHKAVTRKYICSRCGKNGHKKSKCVAPI